MANVKNHSTTIEIHGKKDKSVDQSIRETQDSLSTLEKNIQESQNSLSMLENVGSGVFDAVANAAEIAGVAIGAIGAYSVSVGSAFESQMSTVEAISSSTAEQMDMLNQKAIEVSSAGPTAVYTATEVGQAYEYMAMAGWDASQQLASVKSVMGLAAASGEELGLVSDIVTDQMTAFNLTAEDAAEAAAEFTDVLAAASSNSNTNVAMMGETFQYAGAIAGSLGYSIQDVALATGLMANASIKSSQAGTSLRRIMTSLTKDVEITGEAFKKAGNEKGEFSIDVVNDDGSMRDFVDIIDSLREGFSQLTESEKSLNAEELVGVNAMTGLLAIVNASEKDYRKLKKAIDESAGATAEMASIRLDNLEGDVTLFTSQMESFGIEIYQKINEPLRELVQSATEMTGELGENLIESGVIEEWLDKIDRALPIVAESLQEVHETFYPVTSLAMEFGDYLLDNPDLFVSTLTGIGSAMVTYKIAKNTLSVVNALSSFVALSNPLSTALSIAGVSIGVIAGVSTQLGLLEKQARQSDLREHFGDVALSMSEMQEIAEEIVSSGSLLNLEQAIGNLEDVDVAQSKLDEITEELNKMNWKVSVGLELTEEEMTTYKDQIASYVETMQDLVEEHQYSVNLSVSTLLNGSDQKDAILGDLNNFYSSNQAELSKLGKKLSKAVTEAFSDDLLDFDEVQKISELQQQMAEIQSGMTSSNFAGKMEVLGMQQEGGALTAESFQKLQEQVQEEINSATQIYDESLQLGIASARNTYGAGTAEYEAAVEALKEGRNKQVSELEQQAAQFLMEQINNAYGSTVDAFNSDMRYELLDEFQDRMDVVESGFDPTGVNTVFADQEYDDAYYNLSGEYGSSVANVGNLLAGADSLFTNVYQKYNEMVAAGEEIPGTLQATIDAYEKLKDFSEMDDGATSQGASNFLSDFFSTNKDLYDKVSSFENAFDSLEDFISIDEKKVHESLKKEAESAATSAYIETQKIFEQTYRDGVDINIPINITAQNSTVNSVSKIISDAVSNVTSDPLSNQLALNKVTAMAHAEGGIFDTPHFGVFAEDGPESWIPLKDKKRGQEVWLETGQLLGMFDSTSSRSYGSSGKSSYYTGLINGLDDIATNTVNQNTSSSIQFSPVINVSGTASKSDVEQAVQLSFEQFKEWYEECEYQKNRTSLR